MTSPTGIPDVAIAADAAGALSLIPPLDLAGREVLVKPNAGRMARPGDGVTVSPAAVAAVIDYCAAAGARAIAVGESCIMGVRPLEALERTGIAAIARERDVEVIDLDADGAVEVPVPDGVVGRLRICRRAHEAEVLASVAVAKTHMHTTVSLATKNLKGTLLGREKVRLHQLRDIQGLPSGARPLDAAVADVAWAVRPTLAVVDGSIGMEGLGPSQGEPKRGGFATASRSALACDLVTARLMGFEAEAIPHLALTASRLGLPSDPAAFTILPNEAADLRVPFRPPPSDIAIEFPDVIVHEGEACSACLSTLMLFLRRYPDCYRDALLRDGKLHIAVGKEPGEVPEGTIFVGNCAVRAAGEDGIVVAGCPPIASTIAEAVEKR